MSSILSGFEYDIFISYRHNDNRSGWVTEFVKALQEELAATIKEPVSVYFDSNPLDGLLETLNVDKSLEGKMKCLIFIPILSDLLRSEILCRSGWVAEHNWCYDNLESSFSSSVCVFIERKQKVACEDTNHGLGFR